MTSNDPWADPAPTPATEPAAQAAVSTPAPRPAPDQSEGITVTLKGNGGYDAPWIVIHATDATSALAQLKSAAMTELAGATATIAQWWYGKFGAPARQGGGNSSQGAAPAGAPAGQPAPQEAPGGKQEFCSHGAMQYRDAVSKAGKAYKGFFCPERDRNAQCEPKFLR